MTSTGIKGRGLILLIVQAVLVLSIAAKYLYERQVEPRVWVRAAQLDPDAPLRGRYLAIQLTVDACQLPRDGAHYSPPIGAPARRGSGVWRWNVKRVVQAGKLAVVPASDTDRPERTDELTLWENRPCDRASLAKAVDYFISDTARTPFPLKKGDEIWVEVTVPATGPPRPLQLAISNGNGFKPLNFH